MRIVHCKKDKFDYYAGRPNILGNPFASRPSKIAKYQTSSVEESLARFEAMVREDFMYREAVKTLLQDCETVSCWCAPKGGVGPDDKLICHVQILARVVRGDYDE